MREKIREARGIRGASDTARRDLERLNKRRREAVQGLELANAVMGPIREAQSDLEKMFTDTDISQAPPPFMGWSPENLAAPGLEETSLVDLEDNGPYTVRDGSSEMLYGRVSPNVCTSELRLTFKESDMQICCPTPLQGYVRCY